MSQSNYNIALNELRNWIDENESLLGNLENGAEYLQSLVGKLDAKSRTYFDVIDQ